PSAYCYASVAPFPDAAAVPRSKTYYVYILANRALVLYVGMTSDLGRRVAEHRAKAVPGFTARYDIDRLVYVESYADVHDAIARERQLKGWRRTKKLDLVARQNPQWRDLTEQVGW
ncbi:MAG: GIY-YIG nuclease family protein, partial [Bacteroidota bacterium]